MAYTLQQPLKDELDMLQKQQIIVAFDVDRTSEWWNSSVLVLKLNGKVQLCLDPVRHKKVLIRPVHRAPILNEILPRVVGVMYFMVIDASSDNHSQEHMNIPLI